MARKQSKPLLETAILPDGWSLSRAKVLADGYTVLFFTGPPPPRHPGKLWLIVAGRGVPTDKVRCSRIAREVASMVSCAHAAGQRRDLMAAWAG
jgi:hypothetical protein